MKWLSNFFKELRKHADEINEKQTKQRAHDLFQIKEYGLEFWLVYNNSLVCPMSMFNKEAIDVLCTLREMYILRNMKK